MFLLFPRKWLYECPFFLEKTIPREDQARKFIFPLAAPLGSIFPPEIEQIPEISAILKNGGILGKESNARGKFMKQPRFSTFFTTETLMFLTFVNLEKSELQILKFVIIALFYLNFRGIILYSKIQLKMSQFLEILRFEVEISPDWRRWGTWEFRWWKMY